jgi:mRNA interferase MazF
MVIRQGDVFWLERQGASGFELAGRRPYVVIQNDLTNNTRIGTILVCGITSRLIRERARGNVRLNRGEADLPRDCVVNVSQTIAVDRNWLVERIGALSSERVRQIVDGINILIEPREAVSTDEASIE